MKAGARAEMNHQKIDQGDGRHSLLELQLWRYEAGYLINRRTGFVLDIQGGKGAIWIYWSLSVYIYFVCFVHLMSVCASMHGCMQYTCMFVIVLVFVRVFTTSGIYTYFRPKCHYFLGTLKLNARVIQWQRKAGQEARNQHWFYENGFIANVYNSRLVLDIDGDGSKDGAKIAVGERKAIANSDQQCKHLILVFFFSVVWE